MAHKKGVGSSKNGRESQSKRLGVKIFGPFFYVKSNTLFVFSISLHSQNRIT